MKKSSFTSVKELPIMLSVSQVAAVLNISRASATSWPTAKTFRQCWSDAELWSPRISCWPGSRPG